MILTILYFSILFIFSGTVSQRTKDNMYQQIKTSAACFRKTNGTHQIGCSSAPSGSTGVVHFIESEPDLNYLLANGTAPPYIPIIPVNLFNNHDLVHMLKNSDKISGLIVYKQNLISLSHFTHDLKCPNAFSNVDGTCGHDWNSFGTGLLFEDFNFPIFYLDNDTYVSEIRDCFKKFNEFDFDLQHERSLCSLELSSFMFATTNTPTCIRRSYSKKNLNPVKLCDPLGDENVWSSLFPLENSTQTAQKYIIVASRMDTTSFFNDLYPGATSPVTSLVTLLTTANLLKKMLPVNSNYDKNVLFIVFTGESYDYIGSQRLVYDMKRGLFPIPSDPSVKNPVPQIHLEDISLFVEISQLSSPNNLAVHVLNDSVELSNFIKLMRRYNPDVNFNHSTGTLPPASLHTFLKEKPDLNGLVLSDHQNSYHNHFYNSIFDTANNIDYKYYNSSDFDFPLDSIQVFVSNVSSMIAKSVYEEVSGEKYSGNLSADVNLVDELFNCYLLDPNCKVHRAVQKKEFGKVPFGLYVGVSVVPNIVTSLVGLTLGWLTGEIIDNKNCTNDPQTPAFQYFHMSKTMHDLNETVCFRTTLNFTTAVSPAFIISDYDWKSGKYSTWTESTWRDFNVRMFLKPSEAHERFTFALGSITLVLSFLLVYFVKTRSHVLFPPSPTACAPTSC